MTIRCNQKEIMGFSNVKSIAFIILELVDKVHRLAVCMGSYGVSEVGTRAGERIDGRVNGAGLTLGSIAESEASGCGRIMGAEASIDNKLAEVWEFGEGRFVDDVLG